MAAREDSVLSALVTRCQLAADQWLKENGERCINALGGVFFLSAAAHAAYLGTVPVPLRVPTSKRSQGLWRRLSLGTLVAVAVYDSVHMARISRQQQELQSEAKLFRAKLRESPVPQSGA